MNRLRGLYFIIKDSRIWYKMIRGFKKFKRTDRKCSEKSLQITD